MASKALQRSSGAKHSGKSATDRAAEAEALLADHVKGMRMTQLGEKYGISRATVDRRIRFAIASRTAVTVDAYRAKRNVSLEEQMAAWERNLKAGELLAQKGAESDDLGIILKGMEIVAQSLAGQARLEERMAKLNGADMPVRAEVEVVQVTAQEKELRDLLEQAQREQAAREALLTEEQE